MTDDAATPDDRPPADREDTSGVEGRPPAQRAAFAAIVGGLGGWVVGGTIGFVAGFVAAACAVVAPSLLLGAAVVAPAVVATITVIEGRLDDRSIRLFTALRPRAHQAGLVMVVVWIAAAVVVWRNVEPGRTVFEPDRADRRRWPLVVLLVAAIVGTAMAID